MASKGTSSSSSSLTEGTVHDTNKKTNNAVSSSTRYSFVLSASLHCDCLIDDAGNDHTCLQNEIDGNKEAVGESVEESKESEESQRVYANCMKQLEGITRTVGSNNGHDHDEDNIRHQHDADDDNDANDTVVYANVHALHISMYLTPARPSVVAIFLPPYFVYEVVSLIEEGQQRRNETSESSAAQHDQTSASACSVFRIPYEKLTMVPSKTDQRDNNRSASGQENGGDRHDTNVIEALFRRIHPFLLQYQLRIRGILSVSPPREHAGDLLLLDVADLEPSTVTEILAELNGQNIAEYLSTESSLGEPRPLVLKVLPIQRIVQDCSSASLLPSFAMPSCAVCLHRVDPRRIGLPKAHSCCSKYCDGSRCPNQQHIRPWWPSPPSYCTACDSIQQYWKKHATGNNDGDFFCNRCAMQETLWVCLTCGFVGCGRYSQMHAKEHFQESKHPFSLEMATWRIWDYATGEYVHRADFLQCPGAPPQQHQLLNAPSSPMAAASLSSSSLRGSSSMAMKSSPDELAKSKWEFDVWEDEIPDTENAKDSMLYKKGKSDVLPPLKGGDVKPQAYGGTVAVLPEEQNPKKAIMIGEEYEALLQSALEDQAQHYEGEITRLRAALTAEQVDQDRVTASEKRQLNSLNRDIAEMRHDLEQIGRELREAQAQEATHRATSQRLLREQGVSKDLLEKIRGEAKKEHEQGKSMVEELEQQIADLTGNLRMQQQFSQNKELSQAQIFGTKEKATGSNRRGKKGRRSGRR